ncbi:gamma-glutamyl-gamma-aminobutyrate hydrolase [Streptomyces sp. NHF165]|uniref:gamma-glutamyl-gamma-aminobutyrate hydrolase family protein n=1 Tax=Streptomyces sp. NHF165 TaxID=2175864 RepID=UPI00132EC668|nr:gamma-glutamyl-gamma-aminobutyrate hydrolase family protein [Streptomyces sp. NHF165]QHF94404.1 gamma-glutamyl-gamma-aminobutyrate hydrolase [Streptomyces sp. NHF165]
MTQPAAAPAPASGAPPLIGVSTYLEPSARWGDWQLPAALLPAGYHRLVQRAGGRAVLLPPDDDPAAAGDTLARLDGLVTAGGPDVDPARYGAVRDTRTGPAYPERDAWELALTREALARGVPLLGVCRGMQILNVARGGTLLQHLPDTPAHRGPRGVFTDHGVTPVPGSLLASVLPEPVVEVPTYHHQAVDRLGDGLVAGAHATADGTVEALELPTAEGFVLGVQWHPEAGDDLRLMRALVEEARGVRHPGRRRPADAGAPGAQPPAAGSTRWERVSESN